MIEQISVDIPEGVDAVEVHWHIQDPAGKLENFRRAYGPSELGEFLAEVIGAEAWAVHLGWMPT